MRSTRTPSRPRPRTSRPRHLTRSRCRARSWAATPTVATPTPTQGGDPGDAADSVDLVRETGACDEDISVTIVVRENEVEVEKPPVEGAAFTMTIVWTVATPHPVPATQIDYLDGFGPHDMQFCLADGADADTYPRPAAPPMLRPGTSSGASRTAGRRAPEQDPNAGLLQVDREILRVRRPEVHSLGDSATRITPRPSSRASALRRRMEALSGSSGPDLGPCHAR